MTHDHDAWELYTEQAFARVRQHQASMVETFALSGNANDSLPVAALGKIEEVREFGAQQEFPLLTSPSYHAEPKLVTQSLVVSADILTAEGIWRDHQGTLERLFLIHQLEQAV